MLPLTVFIFSAVSHIAALFLFFIFRYTIGMPKALQTKKVIRFRQELFWDVNPKTINPKKHARYVIERILDFGSVAEIQWMHQYYSRKLIRSVLFKSKSLSAFSRQFWALFYKIKLSSLRKQLTWNPNGMVTPSGIGMKTRLSSNRSVLMKELGSIRTVTRTAKR